MSRCCLAFAYFLANFNLALLIKVLLIKKACTRKDYEKCTQKTKSIRKRAARALKKVNIRTIKRFNISNTNSPAGNYMPKVNGKLWEKQNIYSVNEYQIMKGEVIKKSKTPDQNKVYSPKC